MPRPHGSGFAQSCELVARFRVRIEGVSKAALQETQAPELHFHDRDISLTHVLPVLLNTLLVRRCSLVALPGLSNDLRSFVVALQAIMAGSRDRSLADAPELHPVSAAELLYVLEALESTR
jgi:hypothetical protein